jgi:hypothetical protein
MASTVRFVLEHPPVGGTPLDPPRVPDLLLALVDSEPLDGVGRGRLGRRRQGRRVDPARRSLAPDERSHEAEPQEDDDDRADVPHAPRGKPSMRLPETTRDSIRSAPASLSAP